MINDGLVLPPFLRLWSGRQAGKAGKAGKAGRQARQAGKAGRQARQAGRQGRQAGKADRQIKQSGRQTDQNLGFLKFNIQLYVSVLILDLNIDYSVKVIFITYDVSMTVFNNRQCLLVKPGTLYT